MRRFYYFVIFILLILPFVHAQNKSYIIKGFLVDSKTNKGIEFANIALHKSHEYTVLTCSASGKNGEFIIPNVPAGKYYVKINFIGYKTRILSNIDISTDEKETALGKISMEETAILLNETEVVGNRQLTEYHLDKKVINVKQDIINTGNTALEVMQSQPSVHTNADGNILIRGSASFTVLVDGKPGLLQGSDALRQIPANIIDNIELITNPSSRYDAEGSAGIINIITKKKIESSFSSIINIRKGTNSKINGDFYLSYRNDDYTVYAGGDYAEHSFSIHIDKNMETFGSSGSIFNNTLWDGEAERYMSNFRFGFDYKLDELSNASLNSTIGKIRVHINDYVKVHSFSSLSDDYSYIQSGRSVEPKYYSTALNFSHKFNPDVNEITAEALYGHLDLPKNLLNSDYISDIGFILRSPMPQKYNLGDIGNNDQFRFKINYSQKFNDRANFEIGIQANLFGKKTDVKNEIFDWDSNLWEITIDKTNKFDLRNNVYSAFAQYSDMVFELNYQIGLRAEITDRSLNQLTLNRYYDYNKLDLFPSLSISKKIGSSGNLQFSYSRRINRPSDTQLNPYITYSDSYIIQRGNPNLKPETIGSYELNYQAGIGDFFLSLQTYFKSFSNSIYESSTVDAQNRIETTNSNFGEMTNAGVEISSNYTLLGVVKLSPSINLYNCSRNGKFDNLETKSNDFMWSARLDIASGLSKETPILLVINYSAKQYLEQVEINPAWSFGGGIRQSLFNNKLSITLQAQNLFKMTSESTIRNPKFVFFQNMIMQKNIISLSLSYNFNNFKKSNTTSDIEINTN